MNKGLILLFVLTSLTFLFGEAISIDEAVKMAVNNNVDIQNSIRAFKQSKLDQLSTLFMYIPQIGGSISKNHIDEPKVSQVSTYPIDSMSLNPYISFLLPGSGQFKISYYDDYSESNPMGVETDSYTKKFTISLSQPIIQGLALIPYDINLIRLSLLSKNIAKYTLLQTAENIVYNTFLTALNITISRINISLSEKSKERSETLLQKNLEKFKYGLVEKTDLLGSRASIGMADLQIRESRNRIETLQNNLQILLNTKRDIELSENFTGKNFLTNTENIDKSCEIKETLANRLDLKMLREQEKMQKITIINARSKLLPQLLLNLNYSFYANDSTSSDAYTHLKDTDNRDWYAGFNLSYPLAPASELADLKKQMLSLSNIRNNIAKKKLAIQLDICKKLDDVLYYKERLNLLNEIVKNQKEKLEEEMKKYKFGKSSNDMVLRYQNDLDNAESMKLQAMLNFYISILTLQYTKGTLLKTQIPDYYNKLISLK